MGERLSGMGRRNPEKIAVGLSSIERRDVIDSEVVMARLSEKLRKARETQR